MKAEDMIRDYGGHYLSRMDVVSDLQSKSLQLRIESETGAEPVSIISERESVWRLHNLFVEKSEIDPNWLLTWEQMLSRALLALLKKDVNSGYTNRLFIAAKLQGNHSQRHAFGPYTYQTEFEKPLYTQQWIVFAGTGSVFTQAAFINVAPVQYIPPASDLGIGICSIMNELVSGSLVPAALNKECTY